MSLLPPEDRMPTIHEIRSFDARAAWDRLTPAQQRQIGTLAVEIAALSVPQSYENDYGAEELNEINELVSDALTLFTDGTEPLLHHIYGWDGDDFCPVMMGSVYRPSFVQARMSDALGDHYPAA